MFSSLAGIRAISFDVGGTLVEPYPSVGHVYAGVAAHHGVTGLDPETITQRFRAAWRAQSGFRHTREEWAALVDKSFEGLCNPPPSRSFFGAIYDHFARPEAWRIFDDVLPVLRVLTCRGLPLAVVSNWDERLEPLLENLQLRSFFRAVIVSCHVGVPKPHPHIFQHAAAALALPAGELLHIGDELEADFAGAKNAGFSSLLLRRNGSAAAPGIITSLRQIL